MTSHAFNATVIQNPLESTGGKRFSNHKINNNGDHLKCKGTSTHWGIKTPTFKMRTMTGTLTTTAVHPVMVGRCI